MSTETAAPQLLPRLRHAAPYRPFFAQEYLRIMRGRSAVLLWLLLAYTVLVVPYAMTGP